MILTKFFNQVIKSNWSVDKNLVRHWCTAVIEQSLMHGAGVWGRSLRKTQIDRLHSTQRIFWIKLTRCYRTTSTNVLNALTGIPPLHIAAKALYLKFQIWVMHSTEAQDILNIENLDKFVNIFETPPENKLIELTDTKGEHMYDVFMDGSRINSETGFAVCIFKNSISTEEYLFRLGSCNTVFQAELAAIDFAAGWSLRNNAKINIFTDRQSSIDAIESKKPRSQFVNNIKRNIFNAGQLTA
ncbi:hypothetical protein AVEN_226229-1 [Araneus ventricosus]|nr:hypothetical protein AVEN_226229-1 [Araneus ventricosus]